MRIGRRRALGTVAGLACPLLGSPARPALAQEGWPDRPITFLVPFAAGGASDVVARAIGNRMAQTVGQPVVIDNRSAADGQIAARHHLKARRTAASWRPRRFCRQKSPPVDTGSVRPRDYMPFQH